MDYKTACVQYFEEFQRELDSSRKSNQHTAELSFRTSLDNFFKNLLHAFGLGSQVKAVLEPRRQLKAGRPDWLFYDSDTLGVYGYVEAKGFSGDRFDIDNHKEQIERYRTLGHKLLITDGIDFYFSTPDGCCRFVSLVDKAKLRYLPLSQCEPDASFEVIMRSFFESAKPRHCSESELVELMAIRTRYLADDIRQNSLGSADEAADEAELRAYRLLSKIREILYRHNDSSLQTSSSFADFVAQTIMFTLLYAYRMNCRGIDDPKGKQARMKDYLCESVDASGPMEPFLSLTQSVWGNEVERNFISQWIEESILFLSFVKMSENSFVAPVYHQLFEDFLSKYSKKIRFDFGAFYTPPSLASYTVALTNAVAYDALDGRSLFEAGNLIVDPCCGTGSFLEEVIQRAGDVVGLTIGGIEILPAPYMLANYRLSLLRREKKLTNAKCNIILANTLSNYLCGKNRETPSLSTLEDKEIDKARDLISQPINVIVGNPPCSDKNRLIEHSCHSVIMRMMDDFRPPQAERRGRQNTQKQITNSFMLFLRWSCERLKECAGHSILSFIVPSSFLEAESFQYARKYLIENFSAAWVLEIDADARTGIRSESIFRTLQGRALIVLVRKSGEIAPLDRIHYCSIAPFNMEKKMDFLAVSGEKILSPYEEVCLNPNSGNAFRPSASFDESTYAAFWRIGDSVRENAIFQNHCSGIKLAPTALFVHLKRAVLQRRTRELMEGRVLPEQWFRGQVKPVRDEKIQEFVRALTPLIPKNADLNAVLSEHIESYAYRPFLSSHVLYWRELFSSFKTEGAGTRPRPELKIAFAQTGTIGFAMAHAPKDLSPKLNQFASFCWHLPDNDMCTRGNSHIYLNQYPQKENSRAVALNIHPVLVRHYAALLHGSPERVARKIVFYVYAVLCSQVFLDEFEGALFVVRQSQNPPAVPMVNDACIFAELAAEGERLALLERPGEPISNELGFDYATSVPDGFRLKSAVYSDESEELLLYGQDVSSPVSVPCPQELYSMVIAGYNLVKDIWIKFHMDSYQKVCFTQSDLCDLFDFLNRLHARKAIIANIDNLMRPVITERSVPLFLPPSA